MVRRTEPVLEQFVQLRTCERARSEQVMKFIDFQMRRENGEDFKLEAGGPHQTF